METYYIFNYFVSPSSLVRFSRVITDTASLSLHAAVQV